MSATQEWIKKKFQEEGLDSAKEYTNMRLTDEITEVKERLKRLETDMAYTQKIRFVDDLQQRD